MILNKKITINTDGRGSVDMTQKVQDITMESGVEVGLCHIFVHHTSASLMICENADPTVRRDLEAFMARLVPDGDALFQHIDEGEDDMPAHVRSILTQQSLTIPVSDRRCDLGIWQGIYLWEHRFRSHRRDVTVSIHG